MSDNPDTTIGDSTISHHTPHSNLKSQYQEAIGLSLILGLALFLRVYYLAHESPWYDEFITLVHLDAPTLEIFLERVKIINSPVQPLYLIIEYGWSRVFGIETVAIRWLSVLMGMGSIIMTHLIGRRLTNWAAGLVAAFAMAVSQTHVVFAQEIRMYPMVLLLSLISIYMLLRILDGADKRWWIAHCLLTVCMVWTHVFAAFILPIQVLIMWGFGPRKWKSQALWLGGHLLACGTITFWFAGNSTDRIDTAMSWLNLPSFWIPGPNDPALYSVVGTLFDWLAISALPSTTMLWVNIMLFSIPMLSWIFVGYCAFSKRHRNVEYNQKQHTLLAWCLTTGCWLIPILMLYILSHIWRPTLVPRYILISSVAPYLFLGLGWSLIPNKYMKFAAAAVLIALGIFQSLFHLQHPMRLPWTQTLDTIFQRDNQPYDIRLFTPPYITSDLFKRQFAFYFDERDVRFAAYQNGKVLLRDLQKQTNWEIPVQIIMIGSDPSKELDQFLRTAGLSAKVTYYPSQQPITLYRVTKNNP